MRERGALDSSGAFSVNPYKARAKMARFQTGDPSFYLLRMVQAGVVSGAVQVSVRLQRDSVQVDLLEADLAVFPSHEVLAGMGQPFSGKSHTAAAYLINALNLVLAEAPPSVELHWFLGDGSGTRVIISEAGVDTLPTRGKPSRFRFVVNRARSTPRAITAAETHGLYDRASCCPIPVVLDGLHVNSAANPSSSLYRGEYKSEITNYLPGHFLLGERYLPDRDDLALCLTPATLRQATFWRYGDNTKSMSTRHDIFVHDTPEVLGRPELGTPGSLGSGRLFLCPDIESFSTISWVQAGVILETEELDFRGVHAVVCADGIPTDLSGIQLARTDEYNQLKSFVVNQMKELRSLVLQHLPSLKARFDWTPERKQNAVAVVCCVAAYAFSGTALWTIPVLGKLWAGALGAFGLGSAPLALRAKANLDQELRELIRQRLA